MDYKKFVAKHIDLLDEICNQLEAAGVSEEEGEFVLLWLAGVSLGKRQKSMLGESLALKMLALGWQVGASDTEEP